MYAIRLPRGYAYAQLSCDGIVAVVMPPFKVDININYRSIPPILTVDVTNPVLLTQHMVSGDQYQRFRIYSLDNIDGRVLAAPFGLANVYPDAKVCWGGGSPIPEDLAGAWDQYWNSPFNMDLTSVRLSEEEGLAIERWRQDEWPIIQKTIKAKKRPTWRRHRGKIDATRERAQLISNKIIRCQTILTRLNDVIYQIQSRLGGAPIAERVPLMNRHTKARDVMARIGERLNNLDREFNHIQTHERNIERWYVDIKEGWNPQPRRVLMQNATYADMRGRLIKAAKDKAWRNSVFRAVHHFRVRRVDTHLQSIQAKLEAGIRDEAAKQAAIRHFTGNWQRLHSYRLRYDDITRPALIKVPPGMDFIGFVQALTCPPFIQETMQAMAVSLPYGKPHIHGDCDGERGCKRKYDYFTSTCYPFFGKYIGPDTALVNCGGQTFVVKGDAIVRSETYDQDPIIFDKMPKPEPEPPPERHPRPNDDDAIEADQQPDLEEYAIARWRQYEEDHGDHEVQAAAGAGHCGCYLREGYSHPYCLSCDRHVCQ